MEVTPTDADLVVAARADPQQFTAVFERHYDAVWRYLARRSGTTVADDLAGQVFVAALESVHRYDPAYESARPWLLGIATTLLRAHHRAESRELRTLASGAGRAETVHDDHAGRAAERVDAAARSADIAAALAGLRPIEREVLLLTAWEDLTPAEIARVLGIHEGTARTRLFRARRRIAALLEPNGRDR